MQKTILMLSAMVLTVGTASAQDDKAKAVIESAIKAHGGAENLNKLKATSADFDGTISVFDMDLKFTGSTVTQSPDKMMLNISIDVGGAKQNIKQIVNGDTVLMTVGGEKQEINDEMKKELKQGPLMSDVARLTPLLSDKGYTVKVVGDEDVDGKPATVLSVSSMELKEVKLYFDKKTNLLVMTKRDSVSPGTEEAVVETSMLSDYKMVDGLMTAMKTTVKHDDKDFMTMTMKSVKNMEKADAKSFAVDD